MIVISLGRMIAASRLSETELLDVTCSYSTLYLSFWSCAESKTSFQITSLSPSTGREPRHQSQSFAYVCPARSFSSDVVQGMESTRYSPRPVLRRRQDYEDRTLPLRTAIFLPAAPQSNWIRSRSLPLGSQGVARHRPSSSAR